jgi:Zn-dependent protease with chaperone function
MPAGVFSVEQVERARRYHRPLYLALLLDMTLGLAVLSAAAFTRAGSWLYEPVAELPWWGRALAYPALVVGVLTAARLPLSFWRGHVRERRWGFSTQSARGWLYDRFKAFGVAVVLTSGALLGLMALARWLPSAWPFVAAPAAAALVALLGFVAPVLLEPLFNRFVPLGDEELATGLRALARRAGVPVRDVLVADASRRTRKVNAYVSGLGATRRVVLFDTLLADRDPRQVRLVVAHELGHRRARHVAKSTLLAMAAAAATVLAVWAIVSDPADPRKAPLVLLVAELLQLAALPFASAVSRRWEREADRFSLELTEDPEAFEAAHRQLAESNLSDLDPPRPVYALMFTHPTPPERIAAGRAWVSATVG